jgi:hypothetical protein
MSPTAFGGSARLARHENVGRRLLTRRPRRQRSKRHRKARNDREGEREGRRDEQGGGQHDPADPAEAEGKSPVPEECAAQVNRRTRANCRSQHVRRRVTVRFCREVIQPKGGARRDACGDRRRKSPNKARLLLDQSATVLVVTHGDQNEDEQG